MSIKFTTPPPPPYFGRFNLISNRLIAVSLLSSSLFLFSQTEEDFYKRVGINTTQPRAGLEVKAFTFDGRAQGILLPHISNDEKKKWQPSDIIGLVAGTVIWNTDKNCLDYFDGNKWQCTDGSNPDYPIINTTPNKSVKADVWNRIHYIASFNHNGANIDGVLDNENNVLTLQIPYNQATVGSSYNEINVKRTVQDRSGNSQTLILHIPAGTFTEAKGFLTATIKVGNGSTDTYSVKHLPANTEETITEFDFSINGNASNVKLVASGGLLDRMFNIETNNKLEHQFIYVPVSAYTNTVTALPDSGAHYEKKWLNNNLGANYAKVGANQHTQQATDKDDYNAFGSLFQWQRPADGHELITWIYENNSYQNSIKSTFVGGPLGNSDWVSSHSNFIKATFATEWSWVDKTTNSATTNKNLWQANQPNNPCPLGFHVPTNNELINLHTNLGGSHSNDWWATTSTLRLPSVGWRSYNDGVLYSQGDRGIYWSSDPYGTSYFSYYLNFRSGESSNISNKSGRADSFSVRCIAD